MTTLRRIAYSALAGIVPALLWAGEVAAAQGAQGLASQSLRPYTHVFIAYAVAWLLILGWTWSIARRLGKAERRLER